ncbi:hypothetical protein [Salinimicrobium flavum]|uniref:Uncharacterized protein n=1 Tax=Salinimicrobium flavum TaxID=1737065 RepID=A0ABW5IW79_9FLAO
MKKIVTILILFSFCACAHQRDISNPNGLFNSNEEADLNMIVAEFDKTLMTEFGTNSKEQAYTDFSDLVFKKGGVPNFQGLQNLSTNLFTLSVFNEIWINTRNNNQEDRKETINLNAKGKYFSYLESIGEYSELIKKYKENFEIVNDIQPSVIAGVSRNVETLDLKDPDHRLFLAIHYLTLINR